MSSITDEQIVDAAHAAAQSLVAELRERGGGAEELSIAATLAYIMAMGVISDTPEAAARDTLHRAIGDGWFKRRLQ